MLDCTEKNIHEGYSWDTPHTQCPARRGEPSMFRGTDGKLRLKWHWSGMTMPSAEFEFVPPRPPIFNLGPCIVLPEEFLKEVRAAMVEHGISVESLAALTGTRKETLRKRIAKGIKCEYGLMLAIATKLKIKPLDGALWDAVVKTRLKFGPNAVAVIRKALKNKQLSMVRLAGLIGRSDTYVSTALLRKSTIMVDDYAKIKAALGLGDLEPEA